MANRALLPYSHSSVANLNSHQLRKLKVETKIKRGKKRKGNKEKEMEATPPPTEPRKRGRPKGSTKAKAEKEKETSGGGGGGGTPSKMRGSGGDKRNTAADESYAHWKMLVPVLYDWLASHNLVWPSLSCRYSYTHSFVFNIFLVRILLRVFVEIQDTLFNLENFLEMDVIYFEILFLWLERRKYRGNVRVYVL